MRLSPFSILAEYANRLVSLWIIIWAHRLRTLRQPNLCTSHQYTHTLTEICFHWASICLFFLSFLLPSAFVCKYLHILINFLFINTKTLTIANFFDWQYIITTFNAVDFVLFVLLHQSNTPEPHTVFNRIARLINKVNKINCHFSNYYIYIWNCRVGRLDSCRAASLLPNQRTIAGMGKKRSLWTGLA